MGCTGLRVLGIDPGMAILGYGVVEESRGRFLARAWGCVRTETGETVPARLERVHRGVVELLLAHRPDVVAVEELFFRRNVTTAIAVGQARGVVLLAAHQHGLPVAEYTPAQVKQAVVGYGKAEKPQVQAMVKMALGLHESPRPDDAADALAIALCCLQSRRMEDLLARGGRRS